jgi:CelD/BcsL family acetyltransferase involved in cellulose biosynthesis
MKPDFCSELHKLPESWLKWSGEQNENIFNTFEYLTVCEKMLPRHRKAHFIRLEAAGELIGMAPLTVEREFGWQRLRPLMSGNSDHEAPIFSPHPEKGVQCLLDTLKEDREWDCFSIWNLPEDDPHFKPLLEADGWNRVVEKGQSIPRLDLSAGFEQVWETVAKNIRQQSERRYRKLGKLGQLTLHRFCNIREIQVGLNTLFEIHIRRWRLLGGRSIFEASAKREFFKALAAALHGAGTLEFSELRLADKTVAMHFGFICGKKLFWYVPTFDPEFSRFSPGRLLLINLIRSACERGLREFDFLVGEEKYKLDWPVQIIRSYNLYFYNQTLRAKAAKAWHHGLKPILAPVYRKVRKAWPRLGT